MVPTLTIAFEAAQDVAPFRIVRITGNTGFVTNGSNSNTALLIGVSDAMGGTAGGMVDVHLDGTADVEVGGVVPAGQPVTANATGQAVASTAGAGRRIIGFALQHGTAAGDIIKVRLAPGFHSA